MVLKENINHEKHEAHEKEVILFKEECYLIQGAIFEVYKELGSGFLESVYQECLKLELNHKGIPFEFQKELSIVYKGNIISHYYKADIICYNSIILELKACKNIEPMHRAQLMNYLKATKLRLGLLVNFGSHPKVTIERIVL